MSFSDATSRVDAVMLRKPGSEMSFSDTTSRVQAVMLEKVISDPGFPRPRKPSPARIFAVAACAVLAACTLQPPRGPVVAEPVAPTAQVAPVPAGFPRDDYRRIAAQGGAVFAIDRGTSLVVIEVRRAGSLARLGHDHVVASHDVHGFVAPGAGRADLYVPLAALVVDEPMLRKEAGFESEPSPDAIAGTRRNMLERTLEAERFAFATIAVRTLAGATTRGATPTTFANTGSTEDVDVAITLHGVTRTLRVPIGIERDAERIRVGGSLHLRQSDFGIVPLSIAGGAIAVQDEVALRFRIEAQALAPAAGSAAALW